MSRLPTPTLAMLFLLLSGSPLIAHLTPNSELVLDFASGHIMLDAIIPEGDYRAAANAPRARDPIYAARWLAGEVAATSPDGRRWRVAVERTQFVERDGRKFSITKESSQQFVFFHKTLAQPKR